VMYACGYITRRKKVVCCASAAGETALCNFLSKQVLQVLWCFLAGSGYNIAILLAFSRVINSIAYSLRKFQFLSAKFNQKQVQVKSTD
jgi:hypothetical protein